MDLGAQVISPERTTASSQQVLIGALPGEGVGPEVIAAALIVARAVEDKFGFLLQVKTGGVIGLESKQRHAAELSPDVIDFCSGIAAAVGAILSGPGGGRYVYDLRRRFQLFCKVNPLTSFAELAAVCRLKISPQSPANILLVRENLEGIYQGRTSSTSDGESRAFSHTFSCTEQNVSLLLAQAARFAARRSRRVTVIVKKGALPEISSLWEDCAHDIMKQHGLRHEIMDIDFAAYQLLHAPEAFDVIASPNCFGDILADLGGLFFGSRGLTYGASYSAHGFGVYQTNHGCAYDLAGKNQANPVGQIFSLAMMLRESFHLPAPADAIIHAVRSVWSAGWRTADLMEPGARLLGTREMALKIAEAIARDGCPA